MGNIMTYSLSADLGPLLEPDRFRIAGDIARDPKIVPAVGGVYGWWFDDELPLVPCAGTLERDGRHLLYVGIAPSGVSRSTGKRTLRDRLKDHCGGPIRRSTLRRTLVSLAGSSLGIRATRRFDGKLEIPSEDEASLTLWMSAHLRVAWMPHPTPWIVESSLIQSGPMLPLNIAGSSHPFAAELKALRATVALA